MTPIGTYQTIATEGSTSSTATSGRSRRRPFCFCMDSHRPPACGSRCSGGCWVTGSTWSRWTNAYAKDVSRAEVHVLEAGHFPLDEAADDIAALMRRFLDRIGG
jgi:hypothetical protein